MNSTGPADDGPREGAVVASGPRWVRWSNWAGNQWCLASVLWPTSESEVARIVERAAAAGRRVRAVGSGHSFSGVALCDDVLLRLDRLDRVLGVDRDAGTVTVQPGITLRALSEHLWTRGLALANLGDVDLQTVAGATATGTHGSGWSLGCLSSEVVSFRLVDGSGRVRVGDPTGDPDLWSAGRVSLGALGVLTAITLRVVPAFHLRAVREPRRVDEVLEAWPELVRDLDHVEFLWVPNTGWALTRSSTRTDEPVRPRRRRDRFHQDEVVDNWWFGAVQRVGSLRPSALVPLARRLPSAGRVEFVDRSHRVLTAPRRVRFVEMEYAVPFEATEAAVRAVQQVVAGLSTPVVFPVEVRCVAPDDIPLSPAHGRATTFVAVHVHRDHPHEEYFTRVEAELRALDGRPHWGKLHGRTAEDLEPAYPGWSSFRAVRDRLDPDRRFTNPALRRVLGP